MVEFIKEYCQKNNINKISGEYKKTEKNSLCYHFFNKLKLINDSKYFFELSSSVKKSNLLNIVLEKPNYS